MEFVQDLLTAATQIIAIAGITGIVAHSFWSQHQRFMTEFCPPVAPYKPDTQTEVEEVEAIATVEEPQPEQPVIEDVWEMPISSSPARYWLRPTGITKPMLMLCPAKEEAKPTKKTRQPANKPVNKAPKTPTKPRTTNRKRKTA